MISNVKKNHVLLDFINQELIYIPESGIYDILERTIVSEKQLLIIDERLLRQKYLFNLE